MAARGGHFERALCCVLPANILEVDCEVLQFAEQRFSFYAVRLALDDSDDRTVEQIEDIEQRTDRVDVRKTSFSETTPL